MRGKSALIGRRRNPLSPNENELVKFALNVRNSRVGGLGRHEITAGASIDKLRTVVQTLFRQILPKYGYKIREEQISFAMELLDALAGRRTLLAELPTGNGKSIVMVIIGILIRRSEINKTWSGSFFPGMSCVEWLQMGVLISTSSIALQKAIHTEVIPEISAILTEWGIICDNIDTLKDSGDDLVVSVKSVINDAYCRDISVKTRSALNVKRDNGDFVGACPIYGYRKADDNNNQLVIDEYPAGIVRDIFRMKIDGVNALKIAETLNNTGVLSPIEYKKDRELPHPKGGYADRDGAKWSATTVIRILNDETYIGTLIQGKSGTPNYKLKELVQKPEGEWRVIENAHESIIKKHNFDLAQKILRLDTRTSPHSDKVYIFSGILICGCCGNRMTRKAAI